MKNNLPYLHGFTETEQKRLIKQARFAEQTIFNNIDFSQNKKILEVGCGVGAQTEIILRRFPDVTITGIDLNEDQLNAAKNYLQNFSYTKNRYALQKMSADDLKFESNAFDGAFLCWVLEHVKDPERVLGEIRRVLSPGSTLVCNEVMNSSFFLDPYSPHVWKYWMAFNDYQYDKAGDPFIGAKLGNLLLKVGFQSVSTEIKTWHFDNRFPQKRKEAISFWSELLMSAKDLLIAENYVDENCVNQASKEFEKVAKDPNAVFLFSFMQAKAISS